MIPFHFRQLFQLLLLLLLLNVDFFRMCVHALCPSVASFSDILESIFVPTVTFAWTDGLTRILLNYRTKAILVFVWQLNVYLCVIYAIIVYPTLVRVSFHISTRVAWKYKFATNLTNKNCRVFVRFWGLIYSLDFGEIFWVQFYWSSCIRFNFFIRIITQLNLSIWLI